MQKKSGKKEIQDKKIQSDTERTRKEMDAMQKKIKELESSMDTQKEAVGQLDVWNYSYFIFEGNIAKEVNVVCRIPVEGSSVVSEWQDSVKSLENLKERCVCLMRYPLLPPQNPPTNVVFGYDFYDTKSIDLALNNSNFLKDFKKVGKNIKFILAYDKDQQIRIEKQLGRALPHVFNPKNSFATKLLPNLSIEMAETMFKNVQHGIPQGTCQPSQTFTKTFTNSQDQIVSNSKNVQSECLACNKTIEEYNQVYKAFLWFEQHYYSGFDEITRWRENYIEESLAVEFKEHNVKCNISGIEYWIMCDVYNKSKRYDGVRDILGPNLFESKYIHRQIVDRQHVFSFKLTGRK
jgi:hypothetical protein